MLEGASDMSIRAHGNIARDNAFQHIGNVYHQYGQESSPEEKEELAGLRVLESLRFPSIEDRYDGIDKAHEKTFEWIFHDPQARDKPWTNFAEWLTQGNGIYWIGGRAGSGKSTLMRYIHDNSQTQVLLRQWSDATEAPIVASFFFWKSGTADQASQEGLMRSLLYDILSQRPSLVKHVCRDAWQTSLKGVKSAGARPYSWKRERVKQAFEDLCDTDFGKACLFVDGLDECSGDAMDTIEILRSVIRKSSDIKICVSSRPELVFKEEFKEDPRLMLQDLTFDDIKLYVHDTLLENKMMKTLYLQEPVEAPELVTEIVEAANGVFLWVMLVLRSLLHGLRNHDDIARLKQRLQAMPVQIEKLYEHMLYQIEPIYAQDAFRIFQLMSMAHIQSSLFNRSLPGLTALGLSLALEEDRLMAITADEKTLDKENIKKRIASVDDKLRVCCAGLLELSSSTRPKVAPNSVSVEQNEFPSNCLDDSPEIQYLHRTTKDFLDTVDRLDLLLRAAPQVGFSPCASLVRSRLIQYKTLHFPLECDEENRGQNLNWTFMESVDCTMHLASKAELETKDSQTRLIDELDRTIARLWFSESSETVGHWGEYISFDYNRPCKWHDDFVAVAVTYGLVLYVTRKLQLDNTLLRKKKGRPYLDYAIRPTPGNPGKIDIKMVEVLLKYGADPNEKFNTWSAWQNLLYEGMRHEKFSFMIAELLLQNGADPYACTESTKRVSKRQWTQVYTPALDVIRQMSNDHHEQPEDYELARTKLIDLLLQKQQRTNKTSRVFKWVNGLGKKMKS